LKKYLKLGGELKIKAIHSLTELVDSYEIIVNCAGWEAKQLTEDSKVYPVRGQTEIARFNEKMKSRYSFNELLKSCNL
jgi:hypothetical protein